MIIDLRKLKASGKTETDFYFEFEPQEGLSSLPEVTVLSPVKVTGRAVITGTHSMFIEGEVNYVLSGNCTRCLEHTEKECVAEFSGEAEENDEECYKLVNDAVDVKKIAEETIILNLPVNFLCKDDCKGICAGCGVNLNNGICKCGK